MQALISPHTHAKQLHLAFSDYMQPLILLVNEWLYQCEDHGLSSTQTIPLTKIVCMCCT